MHKIVRQTTRILIRILLFKKFETYNKIEHLLMKLMMNAMSQTTEEKNNVPRIDNYFDESFIKIYELIIDVE